MIIAGAGGFAKELAHVLTGIFPSRELFFFDDTNNENSFFLSKYIILRSMEQAASHKHFHNNHFAIGVGTPKARFTFYNKFVKEDFIIQQVISKTAVIGTTENIIEDGVVIMDHVIIETCNKIGRATLIHAGSFISHDVTIGEFCEVSPYVKLLGNVTVGNRCSIGAGAVVLPGLSIGDGAVIGAGAVVTKSVMANRVVAGVPAVELKRH